MRLLDRYVGIFGCWLLTWHRRLAGLFLRRPPVTEPRHILVIKLWGLGSILLTGPALRAIKQRYPDARLTFLTFPENVSAVAMLGLADDIWTFDTRSLLRVLAWVNGFRRRCHREHVDTVLDMEFFSHAPMILSVLSGARRRVGFFMRGIYRGDLLTDRCNFNPYRNVVEIFCCFAGRIGAPCDDFSYVRPQVAAEDAVAASELLAQCGLPREAPLVALNASVSELGEELRRWPQERWAELADRLVEEAGAAVVFVAGPSEVPYINATIAAAKRRDMICSLAGKTSVHQLAAVLQLASAVVSCASGPVPLAACLGTPTVALFGSETPVLYGPLGEQHRTIYKGPYCSPCLSVYNEKIVDFTCDRRCMLDITVDEVLAATQQALAHKREATGHAGGA